MQLTKSQDLVSAIRATGSQNLILLPGDRFTSEHAGSLTYAPTDSTNNYGYSAHYYRSPFDDTNEESFENYWFNDLLGIKQTRPIVITEFGNTGLFNTSTGNYDGARLPDCQTSNEKKMLRTIPYFAHYNKIGFAAFQWSTYSADHNKCNSIVRTGSVDNDASARFSLISSYVNHNATPYGTVFFTEIVTYPDTFENLVNNHTFRYGWFVYWSTFINTASNVYAGFAVQTGATDRDTNLFVPVAYPPLAPGLFRSLDDVRLRSGTFTKEANSSYTLGFTHKSSVPINYQIINAATGSVLHTGSFPAASNYTLVTSTGGLGSAPTPISAYVQFRLGGLSSYSEYRIKNVYVTKN